MGKRSLSEKNIQQGKSSDDQDEPLRLQEAVFNTINLAILSTTPEGFITSFNREAENLLGYSSKDIIGKVTPSIFCDLVLSKQRVDKGSEKFNKTTTPEFKIFIAKVFENNPAHNEWILVRKDGSKFPAIVSIVALPHKNGSPKGFVWSIKENPGEFKIKEENIEVPTPKQPRKKHKFADENLRFFSNQVNLNAITDFSGQLNRISPGWTKLLGWSEQELKSKPFLHYVHSEDILPTEKIYRSIIEGNKVLTFENRILCKDGSYRWLLWGCASDPVTQMIYASAIDITERKKSEENIRDSKTSLETITQKLQEQNRQLDEFAHIISHNLRAPVKNIQALIDLLDDKSLITDYKLIFDKLKNVSKNLSETMNELMDTLKVKTNPNTELTEIRFKELLDKVVQSLEGELIVAHASVTFDFNQAPSLHYVKTYLESIFQNLLTNAIKYRAPKRKPLIHFQTSISNNQIELRVSDNGQGIDLERFGDKIFGLHKTFHHHQEARGVGLFLIKTQIESMGGKISVESAMDKGTTFIIRFGN